MEELCFGCMRPRGDGPECPHCGYPADGQNQPHQLPAGTVLRGQFVVGRVLGQGGFGITYLGYDTFLQRKVAIKEYYPNGLVTRDSMVSASVVSVDSGSTFRNGLNRFLREARMLAKLTDVPQIVHVHSMFADQGTAYIIMEYLEGRDLRAHLKSLGRSMTPAETFGILRPVMEALGMVHAEGLIHRDISPDNIMLLSGGGIKLLDFGTARETELTEPGQELSRSTEAVLKHGFAPLEQYQRRGSLGPWTDVYALCATAYYCMTGVMPPDAPERAVDGTPVPWEDIPGLTEAQRQTLARGMALPVRQRIPSVAELEQELFRKKKKEIKPLPKPGAAAHKKEAPKKEVHKKEAPKEKKQPSPRRLPPWLIPGAAAAAVLLLVSALAIAGLSGGAPKDTEPENDTLPAMQTGPDTAREENGEPVPQQPAWYDNLLYADDLPYDEYDALLMDAASQDLFYGLEIRRYQVAGVTFLDSLEGAPEKCTELPAASGGIVAWTEPAGLLFDVYIAAEGGINGRLAAEGLLCGMVNLRTVAFNGCFHTEESLSLSFMFAGCKLLEELDVSGLATGTVRDMRGMFYGCENLKQLDITGFDTSRLESSAWMFLDCRSLESLDMSRFSAQYLRDLSEMFHNCASLKSLDLSKFHTGNARMMHSMFAGCTSLERLDISGLRTGTVTEFVNMFAGCAALTELDVSHFNTSRAIWMEGMFADCSSLAYLDLRSFNTAQVEDMSQMLLGCPAQVELGDWETDSAVRWDDFMDWGRQVDGRDWEQLFEKNGGSAPE